MEQTTQRFKLQPEKQCKTGRQGWLNEDNEIEPGENKKQLNKGMLGYLNKDEIELQGSNEDNEIEPGESKKQLNRGRLGW